MASEYLFGLTGVLADLAKRSALSISGGSLTVAHDCCYWLALVILVVIGTFHLFPQKVFNLSTFCKSSQNGKSYLGCPPIFFILQTDFPVTAPKPFKSPKKKLANFLKMDIFKMSKIKNLGGKSFGKNQL
jgi:hypothetical protein